GAGGVNAELDPQRPPLTLRGQQALEQSVGRQDLRRTRGQDLGSAPHVLGQGVGTSRFGHGWSVCRTGTPLLRPPALKLDTVRSPEAQKRHGWSVARVIPTRGPDSTWPTRSGIETSSITDP